jgi:hypothetical protein
MRVVQGISAVALVASLAFAGVTGVAAAQTKEKTAALLLAGGVKAAMQKKMKTVVPGMKMTKVTCAVPKKAKSLAGRCQARFTVAKYNLNGVYQVKASMNGNGVVTWSTSSVKCTDSKTKKPIAC